MDIIVKIMVEVISILGIVTKEIGEGRTSMHLHVYISPHVDVHGEKYLKKIFGKNDVKDAFQRLDKLTPEEALMAAAETMTITRDIDDTVKDVVKGLEDVHGGVQVVDSIVKGVDHNVKDVAHVVKDVDYIVRDVNHIVKDVDYVVKDVDHIVKGVDHGVKVVDHKVNSVINGGSFFY